MKISMADMMKFRTDLSSFVVHLTRKHDSNSEEENLKSILTSQSILTKTSYGFDKDVLEERSIKVLSFTETPFESLFVLTSEMIGRKKKLSQWGIAFPKYSARLLGANPILYVHAFPNQYGGSYQPADALRVLMTVLNKKQESEKKEDEYLCGAIETLLAFSAKMSREGWNNEWWWEREWRKVGDFQFSPEDIAFCLSPRDQVLDMEAWCKSNLGHDIRFVSPDWTLEEALGHLIGIPEEKPAWPQKRYQ